MTDDRLPTDWGDDRLAATFAAMSSGRPTPSDLVPATIERLRADRRPLRARFGFAHLGGAAAAAVVLAVVAVGVFGPRPTTEPGETHAATFGLEPITVSEAIAIRDAGVDDRELAVQGWYGTAGRIPCPAPPDFLPLNPTRPWCPMTLTWLMERPEQLVDTSSSGIVGGFPSGPAFNPSLTLVDPAGLPQDASTVAPVTFIGHFDDRRAAFCPDDEKSSCVDTFVVDRVAVIDGHVLETATVRELEEPPASTEATIDERISRIEPDLRVLSRRITTSNRFGETEPFFLQRRGSVAGLSPYVAWLVVALPGVVGDSRTVARTFILPDDGSAVTEIAGSGLQFVPERTPPPSETGPSPSEAARTTILGDPITVAEAIDHRDNHLDDTELAVRGFGWSPRFPIPCPRGLDDSPALDHCPDNFTWIADERPRDPIQPAGVRLNLLIRSETLIAVDFGGDPVDVIAVGHFDDHRAPQCGADLLDQCRRNFVVDAILDPANPVIDLDPNGTSRPVGSTAAAADVLRAATGRPGETTPAVALFAVPGAEVAQYEPAVGDVALITSASAVWIVRFIVIEGAERPVVRTSVVIDGPSESLRTHAWLVTRDGLELLAVSLGR
jgi:hypothetical protein